MANGYLAGQFDPCLPSCGSKRRDWLAIGLELAWSMDSCPFQGGLHERTCTTNDSGSGDDRGLPTPKTIELSAAPIDYVDTGGAGPTVVLLHGVLMNHTVWRDVIAELAPKFRCIAPPLPLGAH
jgi:hypothetical protein